MNVTATVNPNDLADALTALRDRPPLVQCLTNIVVAEWTANVLLAVGAAPAMVANLPASWGLSTIAGGVLVNLGTPYDDTAQAMQLAVAGAKLTQTPWVLDPVAAGALAWRTQLAHQLLQEARPTIIRGNASEILALAGGTGGRGVESVDSPEAAVDVARALAKQQQSVIAISGPTDHITDGERLVRLSNGHPWLTRITGGGCALGALMAAFAAVVPDPVVAAAAATATLTVASESAAQQARGPGSFAVALLDELSLLQPADLADRVKIT
jgi:hydroxyethylthiazole kinase